MHLRRGAWSFHTLSNIAPSVHLFHLNVSILITSFYNKLVVQEDPVEKGMATHSSVLAWRISWTKEPFRVLSMESQRVGHD